MSCFVIINSTDDYWNAHLHPKPVLSIEKYQFSSSLIFKFLKYSSIVGFPANRAKRWCLLKVEIITAHDIPLYNVCTYHFSCSYFTLYLVAFSKYDVFVMRYRMSDAHTFDIYGICLIIWGTSDRSCIYQTYDIQRLYSMPKTQFFNRVHALHK